MGEKRVGVDSSSPPKKKRAKRYSSRDDDRISQLPDEILVDILSLLSLKEAARTSVLSSRWMNLWKHTTSLNFDAQSSLDKVKKQYKLLKRERRKYVKWVNSVLRSHTSSTLKQFRINFALDISDKNSITHWLQFAFSRRVERLEFNLRLSGNPPQLYHFPEEFLARKPLPASDSFSNHHHPRMLSNFKSLKELFFKCVHFSDGVIEYFLHNCPLLEQLSVHDSDITSKLEVCGPSLKLKHLEILYCMGLKSLKVSAPSLTTLTVMKSEGVLLENVPRLVDVTVYCHDDIIPLRHLISVLSCCISRLETLHLNLMSQYVRHRQETNELSKFPEMPKLKKLTIEYEDLRGNESIVRLAALTRASPYLEEFVIHETWHERRWKDRKFENAIIRFQHQHLKVFKFIGYRGLPSDVEFVQYILENCIVVEKIIIKLCGVRSHEASDRITKKQIARENAERQLEPLLPHNVELVIR